MALIHETPSLGREEARRLLFSGTTEQPQLVLQQPGIEIAGDISTIPDLPTIDHGPPYIIFDLRDKAKGFPTAKQVTQEVLLAESHITVSQPFSIDTDGIELEKTHGDKGISLGEMLSKAANIGDTDALITTLAQAKELAQGASATSSGILLPNSTETSMFTYKQQPEITPGLADRAHIFARLTHNIEKWQRELDRGETPTQDSTGADIPNNLQVTQEVLEGLKHEAFGIYDAELRMKPRAKALAEDAIQKDLPNAAEALVVLDYALHPAKREAEIKAQNEVLAKREADRMAIQEKILQEKREKEAKRLPNRVRSWIKKGWHLVKGEKTEKAQAQIPQTKEVQEAVVLGTDGQEIKKITSIDQASESASAFFQDLMEKDL